MLMLMALGWAADSPIAPQVRELLAAGSCDQALTLTRDRVGIDPADAQAWRFHGDAARCLGDTRTAVLSYRQAQAQGLSEPAIDQLLPRLAAELAVLEVTVEEAPTETLTVVVQLGEETLQPGDGLTFADLPVGTPFTLSLTGAGVAPITQEHAGLVKGVNTLTLKPEWRGVGSLDLQNPGSATVTVRDAAGPAQASAVTAGPVEVVVEGKLGTVVHTVEVAADTVVAVDLATLEPGQMTLTGVPAGSVITLAQQQRVVTVEVPRQPAEVDAETGVALAPPLPVDGAAYLFLGPVSGTFSRTDEDQTVLGDGASDQLGSHVHIPGDLDDDGVPDALIQYDDYSHVMLLSGADF